MWIVFMCLGITSVLAQKITVTGKVMDGAMEGEPLPFASVVLLHPKDSTQASGIQSGEDGKFKLPSVKAGDYILRITYVGYQTLFRNLTLDKKQKQIDIGTVTLLEDAKLMDAAEVTARAAQVEMKEDTFV